MKILLDYGHTLSGSDTGAQGCGYREENCTRDVGRKVKEILEANGHTVVVVSCDSANSLGESLAYRVNKANAEGGDLFVSIHLNAFNGEAYGSEVYTYGAKEIPEAKTILNNLVKLGYYNRGIKNGSGLYVIKNTSMRSMLVECCFIDNYSDMGRYSSYLIAKAIAEGVMGKSLPDVDSPVEKPTKPSVSHDYSCKGKYGIVTGNGVRLRDSNSTNSNILGYANKGEKFEIGYKLGDWYSVYWGDHGAFISASYFEVLRDAPRPQGNPNVKSLQHLCNVILGIGIEEDGLWGANTETAVRRLPLCGYPYIQRECTRWVQGRLGIGVDGIFGRGTERSVKNYQSSHGLSSDGIVGYNTYKMMATK